MARPIDAALRPTIDDLAGKSVVLVSIDALGSAETLTLTVVRGIDERTVTVTFEK